MKRSCTTYKTVVEVIKELQNRVDCYGDQLVCWGWDDGSIIISYADMHKPPGCKDIECIIYHETNS